MHLEDWKTRICGIQEDLREDEHVKQFDKLQYRLDNLKTEEYLWRRMGGEVRECVEFSKDV